MKQNTHHEDNAKVTIDQIGRLEHGLLTMRETAAGSPDVLDMVALIQYQEILRLRSELDAALGFDTEETGDLAMSREGAEVGKRGTGPKTHPPITWTLPKPPGMSPGKGESPSDSR